jgi:hypothetical protein
MVEHRRGTAAAVDGHVFLLQLGDGAVGRTRGAGDDRWPLGLRRARPERVAPDALRRDGRRSDDRGVRDGDGSRGRGHRRRKGRAGPGPDDRRRHGRSRSCSTTRRSRMRWPPRALRRMGRQDHRPGRGDARRHRNRPVRGIGAAPPAGRRGLFHRGAGTDPRADGRGREGNAGLDGRRHARGGAVEPVSPAQPLFPAELQPGHEPAHRLACANTG